jgi:hypothetical protein
MSEPVKKDLGPEDLVDMADKEGVAVATVDDGYVLIFTKGHLERTLALLNEKHQERCMIFVKHRQFNN